MTPYYLVTLDNETGDRDNPLNLGKVRANWVSALAEDKVYTRWFQHVHACFNRLVLLTRFTIKE